MTQARLKLIATNSATVPNEQYPPGQVSDKRQDIPVLESLNVCVYLS